MEPKRTLHSGNLVRGVHAGDMIHKDICFVREDGKIFILLKDGVHKIDENSVGR